MSADKEYREHDRRVWEEIFQDLPREWLHAPASKPMRLCRRFLLKRKPRTILDVGCGFGRWALFLANAADARVVGVDYSPAGVEAARRWAVREGGTGLRFAAADALRLPFARNSFDGIVAALLLDNLDRQDARQAAAEITRVAQPGASGFFLFNPLLTPEQMAAYEASDNPTRDCMTVFYQDEEIDSLLSGWSLARRTVSEEGFGFRVVEARR